MTLGLYAQQGTIAGDMKCGESDLFASQENI
jgi:hypothetical protein